VLIFPSRAGVASRAEGRGPIASVLASRCVCSSLLQDGPGPICDYGLHDATPETNERARLGSAEDTAKQRWRTMEMASLALFGRRLSHSGRDEIGQGEVTRSGQTPIRRESRHFGWGQGALGAPSPRLEGREAFWAATHDSARRPLRPPRRAKRGLSEVFTLRAGTKGEGW
jgi:hypothetical protein